MPIYLREGSKCWQIDIVHGDKRIRRSSGTVDKQKAQELHDKLKHELWRVENVGDKQSYLWDEACIRWLKEKSHKRSLDDDKIKIKMLTGLRGLELKQLNRSLIMNIVNKLECSDSTKNRYITLIKSILNKCAGEWEWIDKAPTLSKFKEPKRRIRWITKQEAERLLNNLPELLSDMALFSLMTGLRQSNVLFLEWEQVDLARKTAWIHPDQSKSGRPIGVPLNTTAVSVLLKHQGKHPDRVFTRNGNPVRCMDNATWKRALEKSGIRDFRWHDLRHTWASWLVQSGVPLLELQEMGGWESVEMVRRYAHLAPEHLHKNTLAIEMDVTNLSHKKKAQIIRLAG